MRQLYGVGRVVGLGDVSSTNPAYLLGQLDASTLLHNMQVNLPAASQQAAQQVSNALGLDPQSSAALLQGTDQTIAQIAPVAENAINMAQGGVPITWMELVGTTAAVVAMINPAAGAAVALAGSLVQGLAGLFGDNAPFFGGHPKSIPTMPVNISMFNFIVRYQGLLEQGDTTPQGPGDDGIGPGHVGGWIHVLDPVNPLVRGPAWFLVTDIGGDMRIPTTQAYYYLLPDNALFWMFGVVMAEIDAMGAGPYSQEQIFRRYVYGLLMKNWEARLNNNVSVDDRILMLGAASIWNAHHIPGPAPTFVPANGGTDPLSVAMGHWVGGDATYGPIGQENLMANLVPNAVGSQNGGFCHWFYRVDPGANQNAVNEDPNADVTNPNQFVWWAGLHPDALSQLRGKFNQYCLNNPTGTCVNMITACPSRPGNPEGWAEIDLTWSQSYRFLDFICSSAYDQWPFSNQYPATINGGGFKNVGPFTVNMGGPLPTTSSRTTMLVSSGVQSMLKAAATTQSSIQSKSAMTPGTKWAWRLGIGASLATGALYWYARTNHLTMRAAARQLVAKVRHPRKR